MHPIQVEQLKTSIVEFARRIKVNGRLRWSDKKRMTDINLFSPYIYKGILRRIIDGDTIVADIDLGFDTVIKKQKFRLYGINAPESRTRNKEEKVRGLAAKERLTELMGGYADAVDGIEFMFLSHDKGKYGRILAEIYNLNELRYSINQQLVDEGHAVEYHGGKR